MADSTLAAIRSKVRRLTRSPSTNQLATSTLDEYINTFVLYDMPEQLRLNALLTNLTWFTEPFVDQYDTNTILSTHPLYNFKNRYTLIDKPVYIAGFKAYYTQSQDEFFILYPKNNGIEKIGTGDGVTTLYSGTLTNVPVLQNQVTFTSIDANNEGIVLIDIPQIDPVTGVKENIGDLVEPDTTASLGTIIYSTGVYSFTFPVAPGSGMDINAQTVSYAEGRPTAMLFYDNTFTLRPVPDKPYRIETQVYIRPTELLSSSQSPDLEQWWQYIAYGASKKVFEDRMDMDSVQMIMPEYKQQERLVLRRTLVQNTTQRVATIYTEQSGLGGAFSNFYNGF